MRNRKMILTLIVLLVVGFASVSTTLFLNGVIGISGNEDDFKIIFTSAKLNNKKRNDFISEDKKSINFETDKLTTVDEEAYLDYEVTNTSRFYDGEVVISCIVPENDYVIVDYQPRSMTVNAGETESGRITARLLKASAEDDSISIECTLNATATERDSLGDEYIEPFSRSGVLKSPQTQHLGYLNDVPIGDFWDYRDSITKVVFENTMNEHETNEELIFDVSSAQDKSVMAYLVPNEDNTEMYTLYIQSESGVKANPDSSDLFGGFKKLKTIEGLKYFDTSNVKSMASMFFNCLSMEVIDLTDFDTSNVTDMSSMFRFGVGYGVGSSASLREIKGLEDFDTSKVTNMDRMFDGSSIVNFEGVEYFNTSNLKTMVSMFSHTGVTKLDLSNWDTSNLRDANQAFWDVIVLMK